MPNGPGMSMEARDNIGVLSQRISTVEQAITETRGQYNTLNQKIDDQGKTQNDKIDTLFRSLDQRLSSHIDSISRELSKQVEGVNEKVNTGRIPNYAVILGFVSVSVVVFGTVYAFVSTPINKALGDLNLVIQAERAERLATMTEIRDNMIPRAEISERWRVVERDIDSNRQNITDVVKSVPSRDEFEEFKRTYESNRLTGKQDINAQFATITTQLNTVTQSIVPRGEHERVWQGIDNKNLDLQRQLDELKQAFGGTYNLRDFVQRMADRQDKLEQELLRIVPKGP